MPSLNHIHTYERSRENREIYRCLDPLCSHFDRRSRILGKMVLCQVCHQPTIALQMQLRVGQNRNGTKHLTCLEHSRSPKKYEALAAKDLIDDLFKPGA